MYSIYQATAADIPLIRELTFNVWPQTYAPIISQEQIDYMLEMMYSEESLQKQMDDGCQFIIAYYNEEPVGFASYQETQPAVWKLHKLYVLGNQQGKGTGRYLINHIIEEIKQFGATALQLQVNRDNSARSFYEKLGFEIRYSADFDIGGGHFMNDYVMEKKID